LPPPNPAKVGTFPELSLRLLPSAGGLEVLLIPSPFILVRRAIVGLVGIIGDLGIVGDAGV